MTDQLMEQGLVSDPADLFNLKEGDLVPLERFAEKSAKNLVLAIQSSKEISFPRFIYSLGIRNVGEETAYDLADYFPSIEKLQDSRKEDLEKIADIGPVVAESIFTWFRNNKEFLRKLLKAVDVKKQGVKNQKLKGLTFVFTGELGSLSREEAKKKVRELGGDVSSSVSKDTDYVVLGESPGSKFDKAKKLGIKLINEDEFLSIISIR